MTPVATALERLELDIDTRLLELWQFAGEVEAWDLEMVAVYFRASYGKGYCDALRESEPGALLREHGYTLREDA